MMFAPYKKIDNRIIRLNDTSVQVSDILLISIEELPKEEWHSASLIASDNIFLIVLTTLSVLFIILTVFSSAMMVLVSGLTIGGLGMWSMYSSRNSSLVPTTRVEIILKSGEKHVVGNFPRKKAHKIQKEFDAIIAKYNDN